MTPRHPTTNPITRAEVTVPVIAQLCAVSAGCCEFKGCNHFLFETRISLTHIRQGHISHIVGATPNGPRGNDPMPVTERNKIENLMLLCPEHNNEIDSNVDQYPKNLLLTWKKEHEDRVKLLRVISSDQQRKVVTFNGLIGDHRPEILLAEVKEALLPYYSDGSDLTIDLSHSHDGIQPSQLVAAAQTITRNLAQLDSQSIEGTAVHPREVFAIASIPLLVHLGSKLSNKVTTRLHNRHRSGGWEWNSTEPTYSFTYSQVQAGSPADGIALLISVSASIQLDQLPPEVSRSHCIYTVTPKDTAPALELVKNEETLHSFITTYRQVIAAIRSLQPSQPVKIFIAAPAAIAVACGYELLDRADPTLHVYDFNSAKQYQPTILINRHV
jgi:hypothetical protein